jgi:hypothetical protein
MEWIVTPGVVEIDTGRREQCNELEKTFPSWAASLYAVWAGSCMILSGAVS